MNLQINRISAPSHLQNQLPQKPKEDVKTTISLQESIRRRTVRKASNFQKKGANERNSKSTQKSTEITSIAGSDSPETSTVNKVTANHEQSSKRVIIVGNSILNGINEKGLSRNDDTVKIRPHPGATSEDLMDHIKPATRRKPDIVVLHIGTNDLTDGINTQENLQEVVDILQLESNETKIALSSVVTRSDKSNMRLKVSTLNTSLKAFCAKNHIDLIDNSNVDASCLGAKKLHLNSKDNSYLANNFIRYFKNV